MCQNQIPLETKFQNQAYQIILLFQCTYLLVFDLQFVFLFVNDFFIITGQCGENQLHDTKIIVEQISTFCFFMLWYICFCYVHLRFHCLMTFDCDLNKCEMRCFLPCSCQSSLNCNIWASPCLWFWKNWMNRNSLSWLLCTRHACVVCRVEKIWRLILFSLLTLFFSFFFLHKPIGSSLKYCICVFVF